jgi:hypothetical protein
MKVLWSNNNVQVKCMKFFLLSVLLFCFGKVRSQTSPLYVVDTSATSIVVPAGFTGFSFDPSFFSQYFSNNYNGTNNRVISQQLLNNFFPFQQPEIRILGNNRVFWRNTGFTAPTSWNMINGYNCVSCPAGSPGLTTSYSNTNLNDYREFLNGLLFKPETLFGINLAFLDSSRARDLASNIKTRFSNFPYQFEIGNEPDIYIRLGRRTAGYTPEEHLREFNMIASAVAPFGDVAGPTLAIINNSRTDAWSSRTGWFIRNSFPNLKKITMHQYPLGEDIGSISWLSKYLSPSYSNDRVNNDNSGIKLCIDTSLANGVPFRLAEANSIALGGTEGVSDAFGSALWVMDYMFELARAKSEGINLMTSGGNSFFYSPFTFTDTFLTPSDKVRVNPIYHGMLFFARCVQNNARFLSITPQNTAQPNVNVWALRDLLGFTRILIINRGLTTTDVSSSTLRVRISGAQSTARRYDLRATGGSITGALGKTVASGAVFTIAGQTVNSISGELQGSTAFTTVQPVNQTYTISIPAASASILEIPPLVSSASQNNNLPQVIRVYPNPFSDVINISGLPYSGQSIIELTDPSGRKLRTITFSGSTSVQVPVSRYQKGIYFLKITCKQGSSSHTVLLR